MHRHLLMLAAILFVGSVQPSETRLEASCSSTFRVVVQSVPAFPDESKVAESMCEVLRGVVAQGDANDLSHTLLIRLVGQINGARLNARFVTPGLLDAEPAHVEVTLDLAKLLSQDELALVLGHETTHRLLHHNFLLRILQIIRGLGLFLAGLSTALLLARTAVGKARPTLPKLAAFAAAGAWVLALTVVVAGVNTHFEYVADAGGIGILEAAGWTSARSHAAFSGFLAKNGSQSAGSWLALDRHPSDADRAAHIDVTP